MQRVLLLSLVVFVLLLHPASSWANRYTYHWEIAEKPQGQDRATVVEPFKIVFGSDVVEVVDHSASLQLKKRYSVFLVGEWTKAQAWGLLQTFGQVPQSENWAGDEEASVARSVWEITQKHLANDIQITTRNGVRHVLVARDAFRYANPLQAEIDGIQGRFFSKRLHHAVVRFATDNGKDRWRLEQLLKERYGVSVYVEDYRALTKHTTGETASRFEPFKDEELLAIVSMLEEFPSGMLHTPGLAYMIRRKDGLPHPLYPSAPAVAWPWLEQGYIEFMDSAFEAGSSAYIHRLIAHEKAHFLWENLFDERLKADWIELGGWYRNPAGKAAAAPDKPTNLRTTALGHTSCRVHWDEVAGATDYDINFKETGGKWTNKPHKGTALSATLDGLKPSTTYRWAVRAENKDGASDWVFGPRFTTLQDATAVPVALRGDKDGWSTTKQTEFVSAYAHTVNPDEDMAESIAYYIVNPDKLRSRSPAKYEFIQNRIMHGTRYVSQIRADLTFQVYNLFPDYVYPGRIVRVDITVEGKPQEDKRITVELELHAENDLDSSQAFGVRVYSEKGTYFDIGLDPIDANGKRVALSHILRGHHTLSKFAAEGYWMPDSITLRDAQGNDRHESRTDFGWKLFVNNPLADETPPRYVPKSMKLELSEGEEDGRPYQIVTARWFILEDNGIDGLAAALNDQDPQTYSRGAWEWGEYDPQSRQATTSLIVPDYYASGTWEINYILMVDTALNSTGVYFTRPDHGLSDDEIVADEAPCTIQIKTKNPDTKPPVLDLNRITLFAEPTNPTAPNGETKVDITFRVKDDISGYRSTDLLLRDPQGVEHQEGHWISDREYYKVYFTGDPTAWRTYEQTIILPVGSAPGMWGLAEMTVWDKAQNKFRADFTEIVRFEVAGNAGKIAAMDLQLMPPAPNPFNSQTVLSYFLPKLSFVRLELFNLMGQHVKTLYEGNQTAGLHQMRWDGTDKAGRTMASGTYLYRLATDQGALRQKLTLLR